MANVSMPNGFSPVRTGDGSPWNEQGTLYWVPSTDNNQYNIGDTVKSSAGCDSNGVPKVVKITNGTDTPRGVIVGVQVVQQSDPVNVPATKTRDYYLYVCDDPGIVMECTDDGITSANLVATAVGKNASYTVTNPTAPSPVSASVLLSSSFATTSTLPIKIIGIKNQPQMSTPSATAGSAAFSRWLVRFNTHELLGNTSGV